MPPTRRAYTRVAVVQLNYQPAALIQRRSPLEEPLAALTHPEGLLPTDGTVPPDLEERYRALRQRIRQTYDDQLLQRMQAILRACRDWGVRLVVFPEYSIPWEILGGVADAAGDMVVVAGTHAVERAVRESGMYQRLGWQDVPAPGMSVCPVLYQQRLLALQPKLNPAHPEQGSMRRGQAWQPVALPDGLPGPMGVLICLDFLFRESASYQQLVATSLDTCRFLAVPSLTPHYTLSEFAGKAWEEARRYRRPVLYADIASGGGTSIYVDEGAPADLRRFPEHVGYLDAGDEGVIVADVDLGYERTGRSRMYDDLPPVVPIAAASLVYGRHPVEAAYAAWLHELSPLLARDDLDSLDAAIAQVEKARELLLNAGALSGAMMRQRRLRRLLAEVGNITEVEDLRRFTHEVSLPPTVLPLPDVQAAMASAAADVVFDWMRQHRSAGLAAVEIRLREAGKAVAAPEPALWTEASVQALARVRQAVLEPAEPAATVVTPQVRVVLPEGLHPGTLGEHQYQGLRLRFGMRLDDVVVPHGDDERLLLHETWDRPGKAGVTVSRFARTEVYGLLAQAEGSTRVAVVAISGTADELLLLGPLFSTNDGWGLWPDEFAEWSDATRQTIVEALATCGMPDVSITILTPGDVAKRIDALLPRFHGAQKAIQDFYTERLQEVAGHFVPPDVLVNANEERQAALAALDDWLASEAQTALVLGEFGCGKSTLLAVWTQQRWQQGHQPLPILCNLAGAGASADAMTLLLSAAGQADTPSNRAALTLLIRNRHVLPCFDGFDEMATRVTAAELSGRLAALLGVASGGGRVVISSRDHYFPSETSLRSATAQALARALGESAGVWRLAVQLFTDAQVNELVHRLRGTEAAASTALARLARLYPLYELVHRPLLLGMVLATLDNMAPEASVSQADLYEAYLERWLRQTDRGERDVFTHDQKIELAEALAEQLWRSGAPACTAAELQQSVRQRLSGNIPDDMPLGAADLEIFGGSFFVREGEDRYRFAHKSFLEFFLARNLVRTLPDRSAAALDTKPLTTEVAAFVHELLCREGDPQHSRAVQALHAWLTQGRRAMATDVSGLDATAVAAANAVRLLVWISRWAQQAAGWVPEAVDLRRVSLVGEDLHNVELVAADLQDSDLSCPSDKPA